MIGASPARARRQGDPKLSNQILGRSTCWGGRRRKRGRLGSTREGAGTRGVRVDQIACASPSLTIKQARILAILASRIGNWMTRRQPQGHICVHITDNHRIEPARARRNSARTTDLV